MVLRQSQVMKAGDLAAGRYRLERELGRGGMSVVWLAEDQDLGRRVALKVMRGSLKDNPDQRTRFEREAELAARLSDPHIVAVWERGELDDGSPFMAMEYVEGKTLQDLLRRGISADELHWIFDQILAGVEAAHKSGIVHRDLKPQNILLSEEGEVKLADFGVAISEENRLELTEAGTVIGTARYMSPESAHGEPATRRSDLYAVGIMLYEAWTGRIPWEGENMVSIMAQQATTPPPPPSEFNSTVTPEIDRLVIKAISYRPEDRFSSAAEFRYALGHPGIFKQKEAKRPKWPFLLLLFALVLAGAVTAWSISREDRPQTVPKLVGLQLIEARARLADFGLESEVEMKRSGIPAGLVMGQNPGAGGQVRDGQPVQLIVSLGPGQVRVPRLEGVPLATARDAIEKLGLRGKVQYRSSDRPRGTVLSSRPETGERLRAGSLVILLVSSGPEQLKIGDLFGKTVQQAIAELEALGLTYETSYLESDYPTDTVIGQSPAPGLPVSGTVQIDVSSGQIEESFAPDLLGMSLGQARATTGDLSLGLAVRSRIVEDPEEIGIVIEQSPGPGELVSNKTVRIIIGASG